MNAKEYVNWFHSKFVNRYGKQWSNIFKDHEALIWLVEKYNINSILEIGMWEGFTTLLFWLHPNIKYLRTIDIRQEYGHKYHVPKDTYGIYIQYTKIHIENFSSLDYIPCKNEYYDMIFIDGNHEYEFVKNDFNLALKFNPKIIVFHDYRNGNSGVDKFLDELILEHGELLELYPESAVMFYKNHE